MENGRYMTGPFGWLVARCQATKTCTYDDKTSHFYGLDASMANLMRPGMYGSYHHITVPAKDKYFPSFQEDEDFVKCNVVGTLCENNDWFGKDMMIPKTASKGDLFVIHDTGAHSHSMGFQYNGKTRAPEILIRENGQTQMIRKREDIPGLFSNCIMPDNLCPKNENVKSFIQELVESKMEPNKN